MIRGHFTRLRVLLFAVLILVAGSLWQASPTSAGIAFVVDSLGDEGDARRDGVCRTAEGACTLRAASEEIAKGDPTERYVITFSVQGTIEDDGQIKLTNTDLIGPGTGNLSIKAALDFKATECTPAKISRVRLVFLSIENAVTAACHDESEPHLILDDIIVDGALTRENSTVFLRSGNLLVRKSTIQRTTAGGISVSSGRLVVEDTTFSENEHYSVGGEGDITLLRVKVSNNHVFDVGPVTTMGKLTIRDSVFSENSGILTGSIYSCGDAIIDSTEMSGNEVGGEGGIVVNHGRMTITDSRINDNTMGSGAGTVVNLAGDELDLGCTASELTIRSSRIDGNSADGEAAIYNQAGVVELEKTTLNNPGTNCLGEISSKGGNKSTDDSCNFTGRGDVENWDPNSESGGSAIQAFIVIGGALVLGGVLTAALLARIRLRRRTAR